ncbi:Vhl [Trypoxylus dichotomus]
MEENNEQLRSGRSLEKVYVKFLNLTDRVVEIVWINYSGLYERYTLLRGRQHIDINTYKFHPWIALDVYTKDRMHLDSNYIYQPIPWKEYCENNGKLYPIIPPERRILVRITLPVYSLRYWTLLRIRDLLKNPEDVDKLELPQLLISDLKKVIALKNQVNIVVSSRP